MRCWIVGHSVERQFQGFYGVLKAIHLDQYLPMRVVVVRVRRGNCDRLFDPAYRIWQVDWLGVCEHPRQIVASVGVVAIYLNLLLKMSASFALVVGFDRGCGERFVGNTRIVFVDSRLQ